MLINIMTGTSLRLLVDELSVARGDQRIVENVSFSISAGEGMTVVGPNGAGKSTLMRALAGLLPLDGGSIVLEGRSGDETLRSSAHFITALNSMKPALTVEENLRFWQSMNGAPWLGTRQALERFGVAHVHDGPFSDLSTGQKRRVSLARLFLNKKPVWLLDEPTSGLDAHAEKAFAAILAEHTAAGGLFIAATHLPLGEASTKTLRFAGEGA